MIARDRKRQRLARTKRRKPVAHLFPEVLDPDGSKEGFRRPRPAPRHAHRGVATKGLTEALALMLGVLETYTYGVKAMLAN